jgi:Asparaginase
MTNVAGRFALALQGGAGTLWRGEMTAEREAAYWAGLLRALAAGRDVLAAAGNAVTVTVCALDDDPLFNAGGGCMPVPRPAATLGRGDNWTMADRRLSPHRSRASPTRKLPAFTNFARPTGIARASGPTIPTTRLYCTPATNKALKRANDPQCPSPTRRPSASQLSRTRL